MRVLARHGRELEGINDMPDRLTDEQPVLASCYDTSASNVSLLGEHAGQRTAPRASRHGRSFAAHLR